MATITGLTASRMLEIEGSSIVDGEIDVDGNLILVKHDGTTINAGPVQGEQGIQGIQGEPGVAGVSSIPGEIKAWPGTTLPDLATYGKWVWADGGIYAIATYPIASGHINTAWNTAYGQSSPGAGNFRVPDLRGLVLAGLDAMPGGSRANRMTRSVAINIAAKTGEETHAVTTAEMPTHNHTGSVNSHSHTVNDPGHFHSIDSGGSPNGSAGGGAVYRTPGGSTETTTTKTTGITLGNASPGISINNAGSGNAHENVQPTVFVPYIVRLDG